MVAAGFAPKTMAIEKTLNVTEEQAQEIYQSINDETMVSADSFRTDDEVDIYGE
jgi:minor capsid protein